MKNNRYEWIEIPSNHKSYYNEVDILKHHHFQVRDNLTNKIYSIYPLSPNSLEPNIPNDLKNQEFMNFACYTSPIFSKYVKDEYLNEELIDISLRSTSDPLFITRVPKHLLTTERCFMSVVHNPFSLPYIPSEFQTDGICDAAIRALKKDDNLELFFHNLPKKFLNYRRCLMLIQKNPNLIFLIPKEFISEEMTSLALKNDYKNIKYIPENYITKDMAYFVLENNISLIGYIPSKYLDEELLIKLVSVNPKLLLKIDDNLLNENIVQAALDYGANLGSIPFKFRTYDICKRKVLENSHSIRSVPVYLLTEDFIQELINLGVKFIPKDMKYVQESLNTNRIIETIKDERDNLPIKDYLEFKEIRLESIENFFFSATINFLNKNGIFNLEDLFMRFDNPNFIEIFMKNQTFDKEMYQKISSQTKLLKCKYLGEDPVLDFDLEFNEFLEYLGLETRTKCAFRRNFSSISEIFAILKDSKAQEDFLKIRIVGKATLNEVLKKLQIVEPYYDDYCNKKEDERKTNVNKDYLEFLLHELERLETEETKINQQINFIKSKIHDLEDTKGGVSL